MPTIAKKDDIVAFAQRHQTWLKNYRLIATGTTGARIQAATGLTVEQLPRARHPSPAPHLQCP
ncbi:MAG: hypothetical protein MUF49_09855 [Oculatellaceae cyanobacterium Prado106]|nr:hypothetical protein [Oculatellaceae cyanobacterium Prado106]